MSPAPAPAGRGHEDPGLQPERTVLSWGRTMLALCTAAAVYLKWLPMHGVFVLCLFTFALCLAGGIYATQRLRYRRSATGIAGERITPDAVSVLLTSGACVLLGVLGITTLLLF
ncbi:hypothetical protein CWC38_05540 [Kocuria tytonicola]|uniref:DUF202 domain-containing protein n=1 Tax=Kocuria tytonicola TaxID=2055946 RepID=UPI000EF878BB|nr:DUF202 domain-containing protein [Kocuria tytonicola]RLZ03486.1 hypothetical protein CWC38_05540 [Kocuria tytonicola]